MATETKPLTDQQIEKLMIGLLKEGSAPDSYMSGFQEAGSACLIIDGGDLETKKRIARILLNVAFRLKTGHPAIIRPKKGKA